MHTIIDAYIEKMVTQSTPASPRWNIESIRHEKKPHWNYIDGCMMIALLSLYQTTGADRYRDFVKRFINHYVNEDGSILGYDRDTQNVDEICESRLLFDLLAMTGEDKYQKAIDYTYGHIQRQPRTDEGNFWHKKIYPHQVWLDGLFMAQPFYARYAAHVGDDSLFDDIIHQFESVRKRMFDEDKKLYRHGYDTSKSIFWADKTTGLSNNAWLRAIGWFAVALVDVCEWTPENIPGKMLFKDLLSELLEGMLVYLDPKADMFYQVVDQGNREGNYLETSGSALMAYAMLKGVRLNMVDARFRTIGKAIFDGISRRYLSEVDGDLNLKGICLVAGLGPEGNVRRDGSFAYYVSEPVVENDAKGVAPFILAYTELLKI